MRRVGASMMPEIASARFVLKFESSSMKSSQRSQRLPRDCAEKISHI